MGLVMAVAQDSSSMTTHDRAVPAATACPMVIFLVLPEPIWSSRGKSVSSLSATRPNLGCALFSGCTKCSISAMLQTVKKSPGAASEGGRERGLGAWRWGRGLRMLGHVSSTQGDSDSVKCKCNPPRPAGHVSQTTMTRGVPLCMVISGEGENPAPELPDA
jgi:hypothetical protein